MKVLIFGATGMVGQGVLRECLLDPAVDLVATVGRSSIGIRESKLTDIVHRDMTALTPIEGALAGYDACFFCLGVSSVGMTEQDYHRLTYDMTLSVAHTLANINPTMSFAYVSGAGTDSTERGKRMWARVKGKTENELLKLFPRVFLFRPGVIQPLHKVRSKTLLYQSVYTIAGPLLSGVKRVWPNSMCTSAELGRAMLRCARSEMRSMVVEVPDIVRLGNAS